MTKKINGGKLKRGWRQNILFRRASGATPKTRTKLVDAFVAGPSDAGSIPATSTIKDHCVIDTMFVSVTEWSFL